MAVFSAAVAGAKTSAGATMIDEWTFDFGHPVKRTHVEAALSLSADLTTTADGVNSTSPNEKVDARAFADVRVSGDGISPNLAIGHTLDTFGLSEDAVLSQTINPHTRFTPPMTIPVSLDFEGNFVDVLWRLIVEAEATVRSDDVVNRQSGLAIAIADASHTLTWGGIISVTNADTGELITDYTLTSASGFDYTHPFAGPIPEPGSVPEPSSIGLLASCLALMLLWRSGVARHHWHYRFIRRRTTQITCAGIDPLCTRVTTRRWRAAFGAQAPSDKQQRRVRLSICGRPLPWREKTEGLSVTRSRMLPSVRPVMRR